MRPEIVPFGYRDELPLRKRQRAVIAIRELKRTLVSLALQANPRVTKSGNDGDSSISGTVVDDNLFPKAVGLMQEAFEASPYIPLMVVCRCNDAHERSLMCRPTQLHGSLPPPLKRTHHL